jgi:hypothetical protein
MLFFSSEDSDISLNQTIKEICNFFIRNPQTTLSLCSLLLLNVAQAQECVGDDVIQFCDDGIYLGL